MPPKKQVLAIVKIQLPAGRRHPRPPRRAPPSGPTASRPWTSAGSTTPPPRAGSAASSRSRSPSSRTAPLPFILKTPPTPVPCCAKPCLGGQGAQLPLVGRRSPVDDAQVTEIAQVKMPDLNANDLEAAKAQVAGTARSMGIAVAG